MITRKLELVDQSVADTIPDSAQLVRNIQITENADIREYIKKKHKVQQERNSL